ncbi:MAG: DNA polymerase III subunit epsilon, partial [Azorhizobium sp. 12-66-6]
KHGALLDAELLAEVYSELLGGRQAMLIGLGEEASEAPRLRSMEIIAAPTRPVPLPSRLTEEDIAVHRAFIATMGDKALWNAYLPDDRPA